MTETVLAILGLLVAVGSVAYGCVGAILWDWRHLWAGGLFAFIALVWVGMAARVLGIIMFIVIMMFFIGRLVGSGVLFLVGFIFDIIIIEPFASLIDREAADRLLKIVAALLLVIGFQFDLLAS